LASGDIIVMLQVTTNVAAYRTKCTCLNICKYLYFTSHQLLFFCKGIA